MTTIRRLDGRAMAELQQRIVAELAPLAQELGLNFSFENGRYSPDAAKLALRVTLTHAAEEVAARAQQSVARDLRLLCLPADMIGKTGSHNGVEYRIDGVDPTKPKNKVRLIRVRDDHVFWCSTALAAQLLAPKPEPRPGRDRRSASSFVDLL
jgi:hypothetical protein